MMIEEIGYLNAYEYLEGYVKGLKKTPEKVALMCVLKDFKYCIDKTRKCELFEESAKLFQAALNQGDDK